MNIDSGVGVGGATEETLLAIAGFVTEPHDYVSVTYPSSTQEIWVFKSGGSGGTTVATITINYDSQGRITDATKT